MRITRRGIHPPSASDHSTRLPLAHLLTLHKQERNHEDALRAGNTRTDSGAEPAACMDAMIDVQLEKVSKEEDIARL